MKWICFPLGRLDYCSGIIWELLHLLDIGPNFSIPKKLIFGSVDEIEIFAKNNTASILLKYSSKPASAGVQWFAWRCRCKCRFW